MISSAFSADIVSASIAKQTILKLKSQMDRQWNYHACRWVAKNATLWSKFNNFARPRSKSNMMLYSKMSELESRASSSGVHDLDARILSAGLAAVKEEPFVMNAVHIPAGSAAILTTRPIVKWQVKLACFCIIWTHVWLNVLIAVLRFTKFLDAITWHAIAATRNGAGFAEWWQATTVHISAQDLFLVVLACKTSLSSYRFGFYAC